MMMFLSLLGCGGGPDDSAESSCGDPDSRSAIIVTSMGYMRAEDGVSPGFDLDGEDDDVCGIPDYTSPDGDPGIDNGLAGMIPALDASEAKVVEGYVNEAILEGRILLAVELSRVDSLENDDCVDVTFLQASGEPLLGTDGGLLAGQTLQRRSDTPVSTIEGAAIVDGRLVARPMPIELPLSMLDATFELSIQDGGIQVDYGEDGEASGFFTGSLPREELLALLESSPGIGSDVAELVSGLIDIALDVEDEEGECSMMSAGFVFEASRVYLVD